MVVTEAKPGDLKTEKTALR